MKAPRPDPDRPLALRAILLFFSFLLRLFFRKVTLTGTARVPHDSGLVYVSNHVNSLLDPLLLVCRSPRTPRVLAKEPLFRHPFVAPFLRALRALPVYRKQDASGDTSRNEETFAACERALAEGEAIALFPEGRSHDEPHLQPLKTGAARIAGRAAARGTRVAIQPVGLVYSDRTSFRSDVSVLFGHPLWAGDFGFVRGDEPDAVHAIMAEMERGLREVTLNAESFADLELVEDLRHMAAPLLPPAEDVEGKVAQIQRFLRGYYAAREERSGELRRLVSSARAYRKLLRATGLRDEDVAREASAKEALRFVARNLALVVVTYPAALYGWLFHFLPYSITGPAARWANGGRPDTLGTYKVYAGLFLFPLFYALQGWALWQILGPLWTVAILLTAPFAGFWALHYYEYRDGFIQTCMAFGLLLVRGGLHRRLKDLRGRVLDALGPLVEMYR